MTTGNYAFALSYIQKLFTICPDIEQLQIKRIDMLIRVGNVAEVIYLHWHIKKFPSNHRRSN